MKGIKWWKGRKYGGVTKELVLSRSRRKRGQNNKETACVISFC